MPHVECDDTALLSDMATRTDIVCAGMVEDYSLHCKMGQIKQLLTIEKMHWNICVARRKYSTFPALEMFWDKLAEVYGEKTPSSKQPPE